MPRKNAASEKLLLLTLTLEAAVEAENWSEVTETLKARAAVVETLSAIPESTMREVTAVEERMLTVLRRRLIGVRADMRNLSAALRIASPYANGRGDSSLSLAG
jgi:hypothetical protein